MKSEIFMKGIDKLELAYNQKFNKEKLEMWWEKLKDINDNDYLEAIEQLIPKNKFLPNIAEIKAEISNKNMNYSNANFNSSYWYKNLREFCDRDGTPYYDITKGPDYPLPPFKE